MPTKMPMPVTPTSNTQSARRQLHASMGQAPPFYDQFKNPRWPEGRPFWCYTEIMANGVTPPMPCTPLVPDGWASPIDLPARYIDYSRSAYGHFEWRVDAMYDHDKEEYERYYVAAAVLATEKNQGVVTLGGPVPFVVRALLGPPTRSPKIAQAFLAANPWILGFTQEPDEELLRIMARSRDTLGMPAESYAKPDDVLSAPPAQLKEMVDAAVAAALAADKEKREAKGRQLRAAKARKRAGAEVGA